MQLPPNATVLPKSDLEEIKDRLTNLERLVRALETHLVNCNINLQGDVSFNNKLDRMIEISKMPINIDDRGLRRDIKEMNETHSKYLDQLKSLDLSQIKAEMKFVGSRMLELDKQMASLVKAQEKKQIELAFSVDGYELVKKPVNYDETEPVADPFGDIKLLENHLLERELKVIIHRFAMKGGKPMSFQSLEPIIGVTRERIRQIESKALRKLRHPSREEDIKQIKSKKLREALKLPLFSW